MAAIRQTAELNQAGFSVSTISAVGQLRAFEQTNRRSECASFVKVFASFEDRAVIQKILAQLDDNATSAATGLLRDCRGMPSLHITKQITATEKYFNTFKYLVHKKELIFF